MIRRALLSFLLLVLVPSSVMAAGQSQSQMEVLKSISNNVGHTVDPNMLLAAGLVVLGLAGLIIAVSYARKRSVNPKPLHHSGKLLKEIAKVVALKPAEVKQLKTLADQQDLSSPLLLLLCPSLLSKAVKERPQSVDRGLVTRLAKRVMTKGS